jgi:hypothetical protein
MIFSPGIRSAFLSRLDLGFFEWFSFFPNISLLFRAYEEPLTPGDTLPQISSNAGP